LISSLIYDLLTKSSIDKIDTLYSLKGKYDIPFSFTRYYLSIIRGKNIIYTHIYSVRDTPKELKRLIEYLNYLETKLVFNPSTDTSSVIDISESIFTSEIKTYDTYKNRKLLKLIAPNRE
jgi:hypothetical protein